MNLTKNNWDKDDILEYEDYLLSLINKDKIEWTKNIIKTELPVLAIKSDILKNISKDILKGNYFKFLDYMLCNCYEEMAINALIISNIKDFKLTKKYLDKYSLKVDNWANCDTLSFDIKGYEKEYLKLAKEYIKSNHIFRRRIGIVIIFHFTKDKKYLKEIFKILNGFELEKEYYVNMINAWLLCECFIKYREETIIFLEKNKLNNFTINKAIQKCRDSFRVTKEDKEMLLKYKKASD